MTTAAQKAKSRLAAQQRNRENRILISKGFASTLKEAEQFRRDHRETSDVPISEFIQQIAGDANTETPPVKRGRKPTHKAPAITPSMNLPEPIVTNAVSDHRATRVTLELIPIGNDLLSPELVQQWLRDRLEGSGLAVAEIVDIS